MLVFYFNFIVIFQSRVDTIILPSFSPSRDSVDSYFFNAFQNNVPSTVRFHQKCRQNVLRILVLVFYILTLLSLIHIQMCIRDRVHLIQKHCTHSNIPVRHYLRFHNQSSRDSRSVQLELITTNVPNVCSDVLYVHRLYVLDVECALTSECIIFVTKFFTISIHSITYNTVVCFTYRYCTYSVTVRTTLKLLFLQNSVICNRTDI